MESNPGQVESFLYSRHVFILHHTKNYYFKILHFYCMALLQVALVSIRPQKFFRHVGTTGCRKLKITMLW
jgi:hypothetical protein